MTPKMTPKEKELLAANEELKAKVAELEAELEASKQQPALAPQPSKSRVQAEQALELLKKGPVTTEQLKAINPKYPSDCVFFIRTILKQKVITNRGKDGTFYSLPTEQEQTAEKPEAASAKA